MNKLGINTNSNQLKAGVVLNYVLIAINTLVGLLYTPYMLRMMGQSEYGLYSLVASVISYLTILDLGMGNAIIRYTSKFRAEGKKDEQYEMFGMFFILYLIIGVITFAAGMGLFFGADKLFANSMTAVEIDRAKTMLLLMVFNLAVTFPLSIFGSIMTAYERFVFPKVLNIVRIFLNTVVMIFLLSQGYKAVAMVVVHTVFNIATLIINYIYCKRLLHIKMYFRKFNWSFLKEVAVYSFWIFLNVIMDRIYWSTGQFVLGAVAGTVAVSIFAVAIQFQQLYMQFSTAVSGVFLPKITGMVALKSNNKEISDIFIKTGRLQYIVMSLILFGFLIFGKQFILLWAGPEYADSYPIAAMFFVSLLIPLIQNLGITILQARNEMKFRSLLYVGIAVVSLILQVIFGKLWGGIGCAIAIVGALLLGQGLIMNIYYQKKQGIDIVEFWKEILKMSISPVIVSAITVFVLHYVKLDSWMSLLIGIGAYSLVYLISCWFFSMNNYERSLFTQILRKTR